LKRRTDICRCTADWKRGAGLVGVGCGIRKDGRNFSFLTIILIFPQNMGKNENCRLKILKNKSKDADVNY
jgi:hypothetical protein